MKSCFRLSVLVLSTLSLSLLLASPLLAQWEPDQRLTFDDSTSRTSMYQHSQNIASGPGGVLHVVWIDMRDHRTGEIYYKRSSDRGATWSQDTRLTYNPGWKNSPSVSALDTDVHVVWEDDHIGLLSKVYYKRSTDGGGDVVSGYPPHRATGYV